MTWHDDTTSTRGSEYVFSSLLCWEQREDQLAFNEELRLQVYEYMTDWLEVLSYCATHDESRALPYLPSTASLFLVFPLSALPFLSLITPHRSIGGEGRSRCTDRQRAQQGPGVRCSSHRRWRTPKTASSGRGTFTSTHCICCTTLPATHTYHYII